jgi:uncharacterized protein CbrC (UPF0167 family)
MSVDEVYMDVPAVTEMAQRLQTISDVLQQVYNALEMAVTTLKVMAFIGLVGAAAAADYFENLKPPLEKKVEEFAELSRDVLESIKAYERGDEAGALRFH